jgi:hypothetical protein
MCWRYLQTRWPEPAVVPSDSDAQDEESLPVNAVTYAGATEENGDSLPCERRRGKIARGRSKGSLLTHYSNLSRPFMSPR